MKAAQLECGRRRTTDGRGGSGVKQELSTPSPKTTGPNAPDSSRYDFCGPEYVQGRRWYCGGEDTVSGCKRRDCRGTHETPPLPETTRYGSYISPGRRNVGGTAARCLQRSGEDGGSTVQDTERVAEVESAM